MQTSIVDIWKDPSDDMAEIFLKLIKRASRQKDGRGRLRQQYLLVDEISKDILKDTWDQTAESLYLCGFQYEPEVRFLSRTSFFTGGNSLQLGVCAIFCLMNFSEHSGNSL